MDTPADQPVLFYDGACGLCQRSVQWVMDHDRQRRFYYAPLQGPTAERLIGRPQGAAEGWSVVLLEGGERYDRSDAALRIASLCGWPWRVLAIFRLVPRRIRDGVYRFIARRRFRWFGRAAACRLPDKSLRPRLLP